ncbi:MAG: hypothetical protein ACR2GY_05580 [Phycisphaerales bacterium]
MNWLPMTDSGLLAWSANFVARLATGGLEPYGLDSDQVTAYNALHNTYDADLTASQQDVTRTPVVIGNKNRAKEDLIEDARSLVAYIQGNPATTDEQRQELQIPIRDTEPTPVPVPQTAPIIDIVSASVTNVTIRLRDFDNPTRRGKPDDVAGASVLTAISPTAPSLNDPSAWTWQGNTTRTKETLGFPTAQSGDTVWITAMWYNPRAETGPPTLPVGVQIPGQSQLAA